MYDRIPEPRLEPYEEEHPVYTCQWCGEPIYEGETYAEIDGRYYHESCMSDEMPVGELLSMLGVSLMEAVRA